MTILVFRFGKIAGAAGEGESKEHRPLVMS